MSNLKHPLEYRDKADLFDFACRIATPGTVLEVWWESFPDGDLPNGGRPARTPEECEQFIRWTRGKAIERGLWKAL